MQKYHDIVLDNAGNAVLGATITVSDNGGGVSTIYSDNGVTPLANPFIASSVDGAYSFYAHNGRYDINISATGFDVENLTDVVLFDYNDNTVRQTFDTVAAMKLESLTAGLEVTTKGYYAPGDGGQATYLIKAPQAFDGYGDHELANLNIAVLQIDDNVHYAAKYGIKEDGITDDSTIINSVISTISTAGGGSLIFNPKKTTLFSSTLVMKKGVSVGFFKKNNIVAATTYSETGLGIPTLKCSAIAVDAVTFDSDQTLASMEGVKLDLQLQTAGNGVVFDDTAGALRPGQYLKDVHIYKAFGKAVQIDAGNKEGRLVGVYCRCGENETDRVSTYGVYYQGVDWFFQDLATAYAINDGLHIDGGGAGRFINVDAWGNGGYGTHIRNNAGVDWFYRLQNNDNYLAGMKIDACDGQRFVEYTSLENSKDTTTDHDVFLSGDCRDIVFTHPQFRGSSFAPATYYAFKDDYGNVAQVTSGRFGSTYTDIGDDTVKAYFLMTSNSWPLYPLKESMVKPTEHNTNPYFVKLTAGVPDAWVLRNTATAAQITTGLPTLGNFTSGLRITSSASGISGIQMTTVDYLLYAGQRLRIRGMFKGSSLTSLGNQLIQMFDGVANPSKNIPNDDTWTYLALDSEVAAAATVIQVRILAAVDTTTGLLLDCTGVTVETY